MAVSSQSTANANTNNSVPGAPNRVSFAKLREPLEVPGLLDVQTDSFEWLVGSDRWRQNAVDRGEDNPVGGLEEVLAELSPIERGILMLSGYELMRELEVPYRVVINEAVELAKVYGGTDGHKFVNGVLDKLAARLRSIEVRAERGG